MKIYRPSDTCFDEMKSRMNRRALPEDSVRDTVNAIIPVSYTHLTLPTN